MNKRYWLLIALIAGTIVACNKGVDKMMFTGFIQPANFPDPVYHFATNNVTEAGFELGRKIFYETRLSADNTISCGSCHIQTSAFTHHGHSRSHGIEDREGTRNSPPIMNLAWSKSFMWDGGIFDLDLQAIAPITNHVEMDETMANVLAKLSAGKEYPRMFKAAFGSEQITTASFLKALSQFMLMCVSANSKYDSVMRHDADKSFSSLESHGYELFKTNCSSCHSEPLFTDQSFKNNGLSVSDVNDEGRYLITQADTDKYKFKVPTLRNLAYTAPYMHDGRFLTLDAVFDHYNAGISQTINLDGSLQKGITLKTSDRAAITAFLATLNDREFLLNKKLSEP